MNRTPSSNKVLFEVLHRPRFTVRTIPGNCQFSPGAFDAVVESVEFAMSRLDLHGHLFITVVGTEALRTGPGENDCGFGLYLSGLQAIAVCGSMTEQETDLNHWMGEIKKTVIHEIVHYWQDLEGILDSSEENEAETDMMAAAIFADMEGHECTSVL
jgi:hypothetical protein